MLLVRMIRTSWGSIAVTLTIPASQMMNDQWILFAIRSLVTGCSVLRNVLSRTVSFQSRLKKCSTTSRSEMIVSVRLVSEPLPYWHLRNIPVGTPEGARVFGQDFNLWDPCLKPLNRCVVGSKEIAVEWPNSDATNGCAASHGPLCRCMAVITRTSNVM
jgi:hypothetical protein